MPRGKKSHKKGRRNAKRKTFRKGSAGGLPPRRWRIIEWYDGLQLNHNGFIYANVRFEPSYLINMDPTAGTLNLPYYTSMSNDYRFGRTQTLNLRVHFANSEIFNVVCWICAVNFDPGANTANWPQYMSNPMCKSVMLGPLTGQNKGTINYSINMEKLTGSKFVGIDDAYTYPTAGGTAPANNWFVAVGVQSPSATTLLSGVTCAMFFKTGSWFFEKNDPAA